MRPRHGAFLAACVAAAAAVTVALALGAGPTAARPSGPDVDAADPGLARDGALLLLGGEPLTGRVVERDGGGRTISIAAYAEGRRDGVDRGWWPDGTPRWERTYVDGLESGIHRGWWPDGRLAFERPYVGGRLEGTVREWYADGTPYRVASYAAGRESGYQWMGWEDGTVRAAYVVRDGRRWGRIGSKGCVGEAGEAPAPEAAGLPFYRTAELVPEWIEPGAADHRLGAFALTDQRGERITDADLAGHVVVANFFYASCAALCPVLQRSMGRVQDAFLDDAAVRLVSHTIDPETDTVDVLAGYGATHGMVPGKWLLLTGDRPAIVDLAAGSYFVDLSEEAIDDRRAVRHAEEIFLLDGEGRIRGVYNGSIALEVDHLIDDVRALRTGRS